MNDPLNILGVYESIATEIVILKNMIGLLLWIVIDLDILNCFLRSI